jgi:hypothetical protein
MAVLVKFSTPESWRATLTIAWLPNTSVTTSRVEVGYGFPLIAGRYRAISSILSAGSGAA